MMLPGEEEDAVVPCPFCGRVDCNCCPNCGSQLNWDDAETVCEVCGWHE